MYFKKLEIFGFKSFGEKTVMNFEPGITAVVGPNGCGKSNVFDSIRWVLGEQSIKELRGSSREDVIFNGTDKRPALGMAEVSLTFSNELRMLPIEYDEVMITRRLFRSGQSEYLLNKTQVRLRDIQELLMGTGIGAEAYSMIQQGKVDLVVNSKPEERRAIFDEASGITKYKAKKKQALSKLKDTENNLIRLNDITREVKRQINSIERQANKARRYKEEYEKLKALEIDYAKFQIHHFEKDKKMIQSELLEKKEHGNVLNERLEESSAVLTREINYLGEIEKKINEIHNEEIKLDGQIDLNNRQVGFNDERIEDLSKNSEKLREQKSQLQKRCQLQMEKIDELEKILVQVQIDIEENTTKLKEKKEALIILEGSMREAKERISEDEEKILVLSNEEVKCRNELTDIMKDLQGALARKRRLDLEREKVLNEKRDVEKKLQDLKLQMNAVNEEVLQLRASKEEKCKVLMEKKNQMSQIEEDIKESEKKKLFLRSQKDFIEKLHTQYEDIPDPVIHGRLITDSQPEAYHTGIIGKVKEVRPVAKADVELLKGSFADDDEQKLYEIICETKFIELDPKQISLKIDEISERIEMDERERNNLLEEVQQQECVIEEIQFQMREKEKKTSILQSQEQDVLQEEGKLKGEIELIEYEVNEANEILSDAKKREEEANERLEVVMQEMNWCQSDIKDKQANIATRAKSKEELIVCITQIETELISSKDKMQSHRGNKEHFSSTLNSWLEEIENIDSEVESQTIKKQEYLREKEELRIKIEGIKTEREALRVDLNEKNLTKSEQGKKINALREEMTCFEEELEVLEKRIHNIEMNEQELNFSQKGIRDKILQTYKINVDFVYDQSECPLILSYNETVGEDKKIVVQKKDYDAYDAEGMKLEIEKLGKKCESFGSVNLVAIEEYEELKERFEFLTQQQSDLIESKENLMSTIRKINRSTRQMFMDTFTKVSEEFRIYFRMLFGGGEAQLVLLDPDNVLESGIDIVVRPPGKKLQNITLLSGGEKTLTAIALVFGVFKVNPSPFCVLDEIDAALDESNVGRFSYLLKDFSKIAQFVVITHNKKTISRADVLYGITMPETGCSRVVSVKFHDGEKQKAEETIPAGIS